MNRAGGIRFLPSLHDKPEMDASETIAVCPVDPYVDSNYFQILKKLSVQALKGGANLLLMGVELTYPSEKYGYIYSGEQGTGWRS